MKEKRLDITNMFDKQGYSLLHLAIYKERDAAAQALIQYVQGLEQSHLQKANYGSGSSSAAPHYTLREWVNLQTQGSDRLTVVHFAAFRGSISTLRFLVSHGADIRATNH